MYNFMVEFFFFNSKNNPHSPNNICIKIILNDTVQSTQFYFRFVRRRKKKLNFYYGIVDIAAIYCNKMKSKNKNFPSKIKTKFRPDLECTFY